MIPAEGRLEALRGALQELGLQGFLIPQADGYNSEYVSPHDRRLAWATGFEGSTGFSIVLSGRAAIFVDGRYTEEAHQEVSKALFDILAPEDISSWSQEHVRSGYKIGFDARLFTRAQAERWRARCSDVGATLVAVDSNPIDLLWTDQSPAPASMVQLHPLRYSGVSAFEKIHNIQKVINEKAIEALILCDAESVAWLFNIRGRDLPMTPVIRAYASIPSAGFPTLWVEPSRVSSEVLEALFAEEIQVRPPEDMIEALSSLKIIGVTPEEIPEALYTALQKQGATLIAETNPCILPKACKNIVEQDGARAAHVRDGVALVQFLRWLEKHGHEQDELTAAAYLDALRARQDLYVSPSFDTISAIGPNAALPHYHSKPASNLSFKAPCIYLVDSGGQYLDGTTDVTRTIAYGAPTALQKDRFTRVLKGHIAIATARFPAGTTGAQLDTLARLPLWQVGLDYAHGTGHGVGSFLNVHEGPQRISKFGTGAAFAPGMIVSNEPGYYEVGAYGIRIESLLLVVRDGTDLHGQEMLAFETLTLAPIDGALIDKNLLTHQEWTWLQDYHTHVAATLRPHLSPEEQVWLQAQVAFYQLPLPA